MNFYQVLKTLFVEAYLYLVVERLPAVCVELHKMTGRDFHVVFQLRFLVLSVFLWGSHLVFERILPEDDQVLVL